MTLKGNTNDIIFVCIRSIMSFAQAMAQLRKAFQMISESSGEFVFVLYFVVSYCALPCVVLHRVNCLSTSQRRYRTERFCAVSNFFYYFVFLLFGNLWKMYADCFVSSGALSKVDQITILNQSKKADILLCLK